MSALGANRTRRDGGNDVNGPKAVLSQSELLHRSEPPYTLIWLQPPRSRMTQCMVWPCVARGGKSNTSAIHTAASRRPSVAVSFHFEWAQTTRWYRKGRREVRTT